MTSGDDIIDKYGIENRRAYDNLVRVLATDPVVAFVGAGLSMRLGYPSWTGLLELLKRRACELWPGDSGNLEAVCRGDDKLVVADYLKKRLGASQFGAIIRETFSPRTPHFEAAHTSLVSLPFRHYLTTNYDESLQAAIEDAHGARPTSLLLEPHEVSQGILEKLSGRSLNTHVIHLHGAVTHPNDIILTLDDYNRLYVNEARTRRFLSLMCTFHTVVFVGFSMSDEDLMFTLRELAVLIGAGEPRHFAILGAPAESLLLSRRVELNQRYRVEPIFYDAQGNHQLVGNILESLHEAIPATPQSHRSGVPVEVVRDALQELLAEHPAELDRLRARLLGTVEPVSPLVGCVDVGDEDDARTALDAEVDAVFSLVESGLPQVAIEKYRAILGRPGNRLTGRLKYRLHANIGNALLRCGDANGAAEAYSAAVGQFNKTKDARALEVLSCLLRGDLNQAGSLSEKLCSDEPQFPRAHAFRIRARPQMGSFEAVESSVPCDLREDAEVASALAEAAAARDLPSVQEAYLRRAVEAAPKWIEANVALALSLMNRARAEAEIDVDTGLVPVSVDLLEEAESVINRAWALTREVELPEEAAQILGVRAAIRKLMGRVTDARADLGRAFGLAPRRVELALSEALARESEGRVAEAIECLESACPDGEHSERDGLLAYLLEGRGAEVDRRRAIELVEPWLSRLHSVKDSWHRGDLCRQATRLLIGASRTDEVRAFLDGPSAEAIGESVTHVLRARMALAEGKAEDASRSLAAAVSALPPQDAWYESQEVARLAEELQDWPRACECLKRVVPTRRFNSDSRRLLQAAYLAREESFILEYGHRLRSVGVHAWESYEVEVDVLVRHRESERGLGLLGEWIAAHPEDVNARVLRAFTARMTGAHDLAESDSPHLPAVSQARSVAIGARVVFVLRHGSSPDSGLEYAYELWRRFPDEGITRNALAYALLDPRAPPLSVSRPTEVGVGCAARIQWEGESPEWIVIEPGPNPSVTRGEYPPEHALSKALVGLRPGEKCVIGGRTGDVLHVENRLVYRANEVLGSLEQLFPETPYVKKMKVKLDEPPGTPPQVWLGEVWKELERHEETRKRLETLHRQRGAPLALIARRLGRTVYETLQHFASRPDLTIRCATGSPDEWRSATALLASPRELVLDATAIATVSMLGLAESLVELSHKLVVPRSVIDELSSLVPAGGRSQESRGVLGVVNGQPYFHEFTESELETANERVQKLIREVKRTCTVVGGAALLKLEHKVRDGLVASLGESTADAIATSLERKAVLWTDDLSIGSVAASLGSTGRVWTHVVLRSAAQENTITAEAVREATGQLVSMGYEFTGLSAGDAIEVWRRSNWKVEQGVARAVFQQIVKTSLESEGNADVLRVIVAGVWRECAKARSAERIIVDILEGIRHDKVGKKISRQVCSMPAGALGMSESRVRRLRRVVRRWRSRGR